MRKRSSGWARRYARAMRIKVSREAKRENGGRSAAKRAPGAAGPSDQPATGGLRRAPFASARNAAALHHSHSVEESQ